jgi:hypothetical protein
VLLAQKELQTVQLASSENGQTVDGGRMSQESLQTIFVGVVALVLIFQTIVLVLVARFVVRVRKPLEDLIANTSETIHIMRRGAERLDLALAQIDQTLRNRLEQADGVARELLGKSQVQALAAEKLICDLLDTFEYLSQETGRAVRVLIRQARALNAGTRAAAGCLFSRGR